MLRDIDEIRDKYIAKYIYEFINLDLWKGKVDKESLAKILKLRFCEAIDEAVNDLWESGAFDTEEDS